MNLDEILGKKIEEIFIKEDFEVNYNIISVIIKFENLLLLIDVDSDTDSLIIRLIEENSDYNFKGYSKIDFFNKIFENKKIISYWKTDNHLGYFDVLLIGLDEFIPTVSFSTILSQLKIGVVNYYIPDSFSRN